MKKITLGAVLFFVFCIIFLTSQGTRTQVQVTKFVTINLERIRRERLNNSEQMRRFEANKEAFQAEYRELVAEINELHERRTGAVSQQNSDEIWRLDAEIAAKTAYVRSYAAEKDAELNEEETAILTSFLETLNRVAGRVAESEGASMVLDRHSSGVIWFSGSTDITEDVLRAQWRR